MGIQPASKTESVRPQVDDVAPVSDDDHRLRELGYSPQLKRNFSLLSLAALGYLTLTPGSAIVLTLVAPLNSGGPQVTIWGWVIVMTMTVPVGLSLAEVASVWPTSGGPNTWAFELAPQKYAALLSWITSYFNLCGQWAFTASAVFQAVFQIIGFAVLVNPSYVPENWHYVVLSVGLLALFGAMNCLGGSYIMSRSTTPLLWFNVFGIIAVIIALLATTFPKADAEFVFTGYINNTGWSNHGFVFLLGLLQSAFTMIGYDSVVHLSEEMKNAASGVPKALMTTVVVGGISGFVTVICILFCLGDIHSLVSTKTGSPFLQLCFNSVHNKAGAIFMAVVPSACALLASVTMLLANSRTLYAIARDGAFVFPSFFAKVNPRSGVPVNAVILSVILEAIIIVLYLGSEVLFYTVTSLATVGFELTYFVPCILLVLGGRRKLLPDRPFKLGHRFGWFCNLVSAIWLAFISIVMMLPTTNPVNGSTMNYTCAIFGFVMIFSLTLWVVQGRNTFHGPSDAAQTQHRLQHRKNSV